MWSDDDDKSIISINSGFLNKTQRNVNVFFLFRSSSQQSRKSSRRRGKCRKCRIFQYCWKWGKLTTIHDFRISGHVLDKLEHPLQVYWIIWSQFRFSSKAMNNCMVFELRRQTKWRKGRLKTILKLFSLGTTRKFHRTICYEGKGGLFNISGDVCSGSKWCPATILKRCGVVVDASHLYTEQNCISKFNSIDVNCYEQYFSGLRINSQLNANNVDASYITDRKYMGNCKAENLLGPLSPG